MTSYLFYFWSAVVRKNIKPTWADCAYVCRLGGRSSKQSRSFENFEDSERSETTVTMREKKLHFSHYRRCILGDVALMKTLSSLVSLTSRRFANPTVIAMRRSVQRSRPRLSRKQNLFDDSSKLQIYKNKMTLVPR